MDKIPLQTLKNVEKVSTEDQINNLTVECAAVRRNFKPTVRPRREFEPDDSVDFDHEFEKELCKAERDIENIYLTETLPRIETELELWVNEYKVLLEDYSKLHCDNANDQAKLMKCDELFQEKLARIAIVQNIKSSLLHEVKNLCLILERTKSENHKKLERTTNNFKDIIRFLNRGFEAERLSFQSTNEVLRKLEHTLRDTYNQFQNSQATVDVLQQELKRTKLQLHNCQRDLVEQEKISKKATFDVRRLQDDLLDAQERAEFAEKNLKRYRKNFG